MALGLSHDSGNNLKCIKKPKKQGTRSMGWEKHILKNIYSVSLFWSTTWHGTNIGTLNGCKAMLLPSQRYGDSYWKCRQSAMVAGNYMQSPITVSTKCVCNISIQCHPWEKSSSEAQAERQWASQAPPNGARPFRTMSSRRTGAAPLRSRWKNPVKILDVMDLFEEAAGKSGFCTTPICTWNILDCFKNL